MDGSGKTNCSGSDRPVNGREKNLLLVAHVGLGHRELLGAPTIWHTIEGYISNGWKVWIINTGTKEDTPLGVQRYDDGLYIHCFNPPFLKQARIRKIGWFFHLLNTFYIRRRLTAEAEKLIAREGLSPENTVIYALEAYAVHAGKKLSQRHRMPFVIRFMGTWDRLLMENNFRNRLYLYPELQAYGVSADIAIAANDGTRTDDLLRRQGNRSKKIFFWLNGVDKPEGELPAPAFFSALPKGAPVVMTLCRLHQDKRVHLAIQAFPDVLQKIPNAQLVICGYGPEEEYLRTLTRELQITDNVHFAGLVPHDEVFCWLRQADVFLSLFPISNVGNPTLEALRCGTPVITYDVGGTSTVVRQGENGILLPDGSVKELSEAICALLADPAERARMSANARKFADENFRTWDERIAAEVQEVTALLPQEK